MALSVIVPVLSTQRVSTRASVSMQFISRVSTLRRARRIMLTAKATLVSRYSPSGIMPMSAATVAISTAPMGTNAIPMNFISLSRLRIISPRATLWPLAWASAVRRLA